LIASGTPAAGDSHSAPGEVRLGQLAEKKGQSKAVSDFDWQMIADHGRANQQLDERAAKAPQPKDDGITF
jgi:predicted outer membrane protein